MRVEGRFGTVLLVLAIPALLASLTAGCGEHQAAAGPGTPVELAEVQRGELSTSMLLTGELVAEQGVQLVAPNVNIWPLQIRWLLEDGSPVAAGDRVVELDNSQLVSNLDELRVRVVEAENSLAATEAQGEASVEDAQLEVERCRATMAKAEIDASVPERLLAARELESRSLELNRARLELAEAERKLDNARRIAETERAIKVIALEQARTEVTKALQGNQRLTLRAPRAGIVILERNWQEDRPYQVGDTTYAGRSIARLPDLSTMIVEANLYDVDDGKIAVGQPVTAVLDTFPELVYTGTIREIAVFAKEAGYQSLRRCSRTVIDLEHLDTERMLPGMSVKVEVATGHHEDVLLVPRGGVRWQEGEPYLVLANGRLHEVELGFCNAQACIVEQGAEAGTAVRVSGNGAIG